MKTDSDLEIYFSSRYINDIDILFIENVFDVLQDSAGACQFRVNIAWIASMLISCQYGSIIRKRWFKKGEDIPCRHSDEMKTEISRIRFPSKLLRLFVAFNRINCYSFSYKFFHIIVALCRNIWCLHSLRSFQREIRIMKKISCQNSSSYEVRSTLTKCLILVALCQIKLLLINVNHIKATATPASLEETNIAWRIIITNSSSDCYG